MTEENPDFALVPLAVAALLTPTQKSAKTLHRWRTVGLESKNGGKRIYLRCERSGGTWHTCLAWLRQFEDERFPSHFAPARSFTETEVREVIEFGKFHFPKTIDDVLRGRTPGTPS